MAFFAPEIDAKENPFFVRMGGRYSPAVDVSSQPGECEVGKLLLRIGYRSKFADGRPYYASIGPDHYIFEETTTVPLPAGAKSRGLRFGTELNLPFLDDGRDLLGVELNPTFQTTNTVGFNAHAFRVNFSTFLKIKGENDFSWIIGARIRPNYDKSVLPMFGINWHPTEKVFINLVSEEPNIAYSLTDKTSLLWEFDYTFDEFE